MDIHEKKQRTEEELNILDGLIDYTERMIFEDKDGRYEPVRRRAYGKTVVVKTQKKGILHFRLLWVSGVVCTEPLGAGFATPHSPVGRLLTSAEVGAEDENERWGEYQILEIRLFDRYDGLLFIKNIRNFKRMEIIIPREEDEVYDLRSFLESPFSRPPLPPPPPSGLKTIFFLNRTKEQEQIISRDPAGAMYVEGVAGSGKTSAALARTKMLCEFNEAPTEQDIRNLLQNGVYWDPAYVGRFSQESGVGFVRTGELIQYLKETCKSLDLPNLPIQEYPELRNRLFHLRKPLQSRKTFTNGQGTSSWTGQEKQRESRVDTSMVWLFAADKAIASQFANVLPKVIRSAEEIVTILKIKDIKGGKIVAQSAIDTLEKAVKKICNSLKEPSNNHPFVLHKLALKLQGIIDDISEKNFHKDASWSSHYSEFKNYMYNTLLYNLTFVADTYFDALIKYPDFFPDVKLVKQIIEQFKEGKLTDEDIDLILCLYDIIGINFHGIPEQLTTPEFYTSVFIDEVQDFTEQQIYLMSQQADPEFFAVTVVGDSAQQLHHGGNINILSCFPGKQLANERLTNNLRQKLSIGLSWFSAKFRHDIQGNEIGNIPQNEFIEYITRNPEKINGIEFIKYSDEDELVKRTVEELNSIYHNSTVAVILPDMNTAESFYNKCNPILKKYMIDAELEKNIDLSRRYIRHFTTITNTKGLEFDTVFLPYFDLYDMNDVEQRNRVYVGLTRAVRRLVIFESKDGKRYEAFNRLCEEYQTILETRHKKSDFDTLCEEAQQGNEEAIRTLRKMAWQGNADALYQLGFMYQHGLGMPQYDNMAVDCYFKAAQNGHVQALEAIRNMAEQGHKKAKSMLERLVN